MKSFRRRENFCFFILFISSKLDEKTEIDFAVAPSVPAIRVGNEKSVLRTFYLFKLASSSKLDEKSEIDFAALRRSQLSELGMKRACFALLFIYKLL